MPPSLRALAAPALLAAACGGASSARPGSDDAPTRVPPDASALLDELPASAPGCAVARPGGLPAERRAMLSLVSDASHLAWQLPVRLWAEARRPDLVAGLGAGDLRGAARLEPGVHLDALRDRVLAESPEVAWGGRSCGSPWCLRVEPLPPDRIRLARGDRPAARRPGGDAMVGCRRLLAEHPGALEVSVAVGAAPGAIVGGAGERIETRIEADPGGVVVWRVHRHRSPEAARGSRLEALAATALVDPARMAPLPQEREHWSRGPDVLERSRFLWDDLRLGLEDRQRLLDALRDGGAAPLDVGDVALALDRARRLEERLGHLGGETRRRTVDQLVSLLERARATHPEEPALAWSLARLRLDALDDPAGARSLAAEVLAAGIDAPGRWRRLRRAAAAREGVDALAAALEDDGVVAGRAARDAARSIAASVDAGLGYDEAERAERLERALGAGAPPMTRLPRPVGAAVRDLVLLARWIAAAALPPGHDLAAGAGEGGIVLRARGPAVAAGTGAVARDGVRALSRPRAGTGERLAWSAALGDAALRSAGDALLEGLEAGDVRIDVGVELGGDVARVLTVEGAVDAVGELAVRRVDRRAAGLDWVRLDDDLLASAASLERLFPAPELVVREPDAGRRAALLAWARGRPGLACEPRGADRIRCRASALSRDAAALSGLAVEALRSRLPEGWARALRRDLGG